MTHRYWPMFDVRLSTPDLELRPTTEADQMSLAELLPDDVELDPAATRYAVDDERTSRGIVIFQSYWNAYGTWSVDHWRLNFAVFGAGELIGLQELEGTDFPVLRTVDTSSFLVLAARGRGLGKQMRGAVLALAFGPMGAQAAITSAWADNHASLGVSRALGYRPNGVALHRHERGGVATMVHLRLTRDDWLAGGFADQVNVTGFEPCRPLFGL
ncbi:MAG: GNAT family N-acetyltransferase [Actinomycetota bacterium]|nr:GNAT family N-acetyltransferase [Actinomycetota bacterium]